MLFDLKLEFYSAILYGIKCCDPFLVSSSVLIGSVSVEKLQIIIISNEDFKNLTSSNNVQLNAAVRVRFVARRMNPVNRTRKPPPF